MRHGIAVDRDDPDCPADPERYLTERGKERTRLAARGLAALEITPQLALVSPYVRAQQTADIAIEALGLGMRRETVQALTPMGSTREVAQRIDAASEPSILCVGHLPSLDLLAAALVGASRPVTSLKKAGVISVQCHAGGLGQGWLAAVYPPAALRRLGGAV